MLENLSSEPGQTVDAKVKQFWELKSAQVRTDDPLLGCLVVLTRLEHRPMSPEALTTGLPLEDGRLTPDLFIRAAKKADLSAQTVKRSLSELSPLVFPAIVLLHNKQACLLVRKRKNNMVDIIQPETGEGLRTVKIEHLEKLYTGFAIFTRPLFKFDERTENAFVEPEGDWFWSVIRRTWSLYSEVIVASFLINLFALASPLFVMNVYDRVVPNNALETLWVLALGMLMVYVFDLIMRSLRALFIDVAGKKTDVLLSSAIYEQMMAIRLESKPESVGAFANNLNQFETFREFMTSTTISALIDVPFILLFLLLIFYIGGTLVWVPIVAIPAVLGASFAIQLPLSRYVKESYRFSAQKQAMVVETLVGVETIKSVSAQSPLQRKWEALIGDSARQTMKIKILSMLASHFSIFAQQISGVMVIVVGVYNIKEGLMTMGGLIACNMLNSRAIAPLSQIASLIVRYDQAKTALKGVDVVMNMPSDRAQGKTPLYKENLTGKIAFNKVNFHYPNVENNVIKEVSFEIQPGERVGVIGRVGSGKTTLGKLLLGLYQSQSGQILLDDVEINQLDPISLRRNIGYVPQDIILFYGSVKDNITLGAPFMGDDTILKVADMAGVTQFVSNNPLGFNLQVGERGEKLSGGQRQAIAIARGLLLEPNVLILDEPTNFMDTHSEAQFVAKFSEMSQDKTVLLITHKSNLLSLVDRILVFDQGTLIADGPKSKILSTVQGGKFNFS